MRQAGLTNFRSQLGPSTNGAGISEEQKILKLLLLQRISTWQYQKFQTSFPITQLQNIPYFLREVWDNIPFMTINLTTSSRQRLYMMSKSTDHSMGGGGGEEEDPTTIPVITTKYNEDHGVMGDTIE